MIARRPPRPAHRTRGIALLEVLVAIVLLGVGILGTIGLQARSYSALSDTSMRAEATLAADKLIGIVTNDQAHLGSYALAAGAKPGSLLEPWYLETRDRIPNAAITVTITGVTATEPAKMVVTIAWTRKAGSPSNSQTITSYLAPAMVKS